MHADNTHVVSAGFISAFTHLYVCATTVVKEEEAMNLGSVVRHGSGRREKNEGRNGVTILKISEMQKGRGDWRDSSGVR